jgi:hypothetical protein
MEIMISRIIFLSIFVSIGALAFGWWTNYQHIQTTQDEKVRAFLNAGPRFTAYDGKELCEYVNVIAKHSIGFQQSGLLLMDCEKYLRKR